MTNAPVPQCQPMADPTRQDEAYLIWRLRNPLWEHSDAPFASPQLSKDATAIDMRDAANRIEELERDLAETEREVDAFSTISPLQYQKEAASLKADNEQLRKALAKSNDALSGWLAFAEEELGEFDLEECEFGETAETLCHKCESAGCINLKIRNTRAILSPSTPEVTG